MKKYKLKKEVKAILVFYIIIAILFLVIPTPKDKQKAKVDIFGNIKEINK